MQQYSDDWGNLFDSIQLAANLAGAPYANEAKTLARVFDEAAWGIIGPIA